MLNVLKIDGKVVSIKFEVKKSEDDERKTCHAKLDFSKLSDTQIIEWAIRGFLVALQRWIRADWDKRYKTNLATIEVWPVKGNKVSKKTVMLSELKKQGIKDEALKLMANILLDKGIKVIDDLNS